MADRSWLPQPRCAGAALEVFGQGAERCPGVGAGAVSQRIVERWRCGGAELYRLDRERWAAGVGEADGADVGGAEGERHRERWGGQEGWHGEVGAGRAERGEHRGQVVGVDKFGGEGLDGVQGDGIAGAVADREGDVLGDACCRARGAVGGDGRAVRGADREGVGGLGGAVAGQVGQLPGRPGEVDGFGGTPSGRWCAHQVAPGRLQCGAERQVCVRCVDRAEGHRELMLIGGLGAVREGGGEFSVAGRCERAFAPCELGAGQAVVVADFRVLDDPAVGGAAESCP